MTSAQIGEEPTVEWAVREVWRARRMEVPRYDLACALLDSSVALFALGRGDEAAAYLSSAEELARAQGFHELTLRAEGLRERKPVVVPDRISLGAPAERVVRELAEMEPERLPRHALFEAAPG